MSEADGRSFDQFLLDHELSRLAAMFAQTGNGAFIWQAYQLCRESQSPVREDILLAFDAMAKRLMRASGAAEMLQAMMLRPTDGGGAQGATAARATERRYRFAEVYAILIAAGFTRRDAIERTAEHLRTSTSNVRKKLSELGTFSGRLSRTPARRRLEKRSPALAALPVFRHKLR